ncbi:MAG TPA: DEAD/DEAH box helicase [Puia sp.]|uniref:DEAD/DEAH box helicase n=1 Tax=Puia sp. TaxID=2045100 RepID=UPI002CB79EFF|nr:DEAD/DEAH box helicase [Puia sp.]HVU97204.1 DEAD/DEAH box helicase [Puia sp.]
MTFKEFGLDESLLEGIEASGYENATPVQEQVIPIILSGKDIIASAQTGTGKTAAFLLPIVNRLIAARQDDTVNALVIVPTRELAVQIAQNLEGLSYFTNISSIAVYGGGDGSNFSNEKQALSRGADVVICTPGRMIAHLNMGYVKLKGLQYLVLDEADRMLDMGFFDDIMKIISFLPPKRQNLLFSATMPTKIRELARKILHEPAEVNIAISKPPAKIVQEAFVVYETQKIPLVKWLLKSTNLKSTLIFCSKKHNVKQLTSELRRSKFNVKEIHSDLEQSEREQVLLEFRSRRLPILVATDILSRGIDIDNIEMVINYDVPNDGEDYVHRIGRTARAETDGVAFTFISEKEQNKFRMIEELLGSPVNKAAVPEQFGPAPEYSPRSRQGGGHGRGGRNRGGGGHGGGGNHKGGGGKPGGGHHRHGSSKKQEHPTQSQPKQNDHR